MSQPPVTETLTQMPFWYLRHGETDWNAQGLSQGSIDIPLNVTGLEQARGAARLLRDRGIKTIVASPLSRARATAEIVADVLGLPLLIDPDLREVSWGVHEGQPMSTWFTDWVSNGYQPEQGETFAVLRQRAVAGVNRCLARPAPVLVVAHGALFRALRAAMGVEPNQRTQNAVPMLCVPPELGQTGWMIS